MTPLESPITWMAKTNLAAMRDGGNCYLKIYFILLLIYSWYAEPNCSVGCQLQNANNHGMTPLESPNRDMVMIA